MADGVGQDGMTLNDRTVAWLMVNSAMFALLIGGVYYDAGWAGMLFSVLCFAFAPIQFFGSFSEAARAGIKAKGGPSVPLIVSAIYDFTVIAILASVGWWWTAAANVFLALGMFNLYLGGAAKKEAA